MNNYLIEVLQCISLCSYRVFQLFLWSWFMNTHGLKRKNIASDMHMEHLTAIFPLITYRLYHVIEYCAVIGTHSMVQVANCPMAMSKIPSLVQNEV